MENNDEEKVETPDILGKVENPSVRAELVQFKGPSAKTMRAKHRIFQIEMWVMRQHRVVGDGELLEHIEMTYDLPKDQARKLLQIVVKDYARKHLVFDKQMQPKEQGKL
jgi:hypothetical protein